MESSGRENNFSITPKEEPPSLEAMHKRLAGLEKQFKDFRIIGDGTINFSGDMEKGFSANVG
jgi:hypothetical protein